MKYAKSLILNGAILMLAACSGHDDQKPNTQVAAKVNGKEISIHQINQVLKTVPGLTSETVRTARKQILDKLIDEEIAVQEAGKENIDRSPDIVMNIEAAKRQIIANAYITKLVSESIKVSDDDINKYYQENPALFSHRRVYSLQDIVVENKESLKLTQSDSSLKFKTAQDFMAWLKLRTTNYSGSSYVRPAEQIPLDLLNKLQDLNQGDVIIIESQKSTHVIFLEDAQLLPVKIEDAKLAIKTYLINTKAKEFVIAKMKELKDSSKIEYVGEFSPKTEEDKQSVINKGVTGLH